MGKRTIVVASANKNKIKEIESIFSDYEIVSMESLGFSDDIEENGSTFAENARIKASTVCKALGVSAMSDDSGLCVDALNGAPGIYSSRYSGEGTPGNRKLLLKNMEGITDRRAYFCCCVCLCTPDGDVVYGEGRTYGRILTEETGSEGFGYDPLFFSDDLGKSFGEASATEKNAVSHRARALNDLKSKIGEIKL